MPTTRKTKADAAADESRPLSLPESGTNPAKLSDVELLHMAIAATPDPLPGKEGRAIPATRFAQDVAMCNDRTLRRYQAGARSLPRLLRDKLETIVAAAAARNGNGKAAK